jgi:catechol 2,3-dioxygenase-like lactoylglutathione lyase family enzyme
MLLGLRTAIYRTSDLEAGKRWYTKILGTAPYFDQPFYVGYNSSFRREAVE